MKKLRSQIPRNIYERAQLADAGDPDFYAGPTVVDKSPNGSAGAANRNARLQERMERTRKASADSAAKRRGAAKIAKAEKRRTMIDRVRSFFGLARPGTAR